MSSRHDRRAQEAKGNESAGTERRGKDPERTGCPYSELTESHTYLSRAGSAVAQA